MIDSTQALELLEPDSSLGQSIPAFEKREGQDEMVSLICRALNEENFTVIEAGTGIGKSFAYLIPLMLAAAKQEDQHFIVSTGTINLQYQLYEKDLPFLCSHIDPTLRIALLMGRNNYLCLRRLRYETEKDELLIPHSQDPLGEIYRWAKTTQRGIKTELPNYNPPGVWASVCSDADVCLGRRCSHREECFVNRARKEASEAQIIVVNHHVVFADVSVKQQAESFQEDGLLPSYTTLVCDEAHRLEEGARQYFSDAASTPQIIRILSRLWNTGSAKESGLLQRLKQHSADPQAWEAYPDTQRRVIATAETVDAAAAELAGGQQKYWVRSQESTVQGRLMDSLAQLISSLGEMINLLSRMEHSIDEGEDEQLVYLLMLFSGQNRKLQGILDVYTRFQRYTREEDSIFWIEQLSRSEKQKTFRFIITPHSASPILKEALFSHLETLIAVSATLAVNGSFDHWKKAMGLEDIPLIEAIVRSPFDYRNNVLLGIPVDAPPVETGEAYAEYLKSAVFDLALLSEGRTLVLFTSFQLLRQIHDHLEKPLAEAGIQSLVQLPGSDRYRLLAQFKEEGAKRVLFATDSFWEGIDVPGEALLQVIITRLPFQVPVEPVYLARQEKILQEGGNPFMEMALPRAAMKLKQGFGRLIRTSADRGIVLILDNRLLTKSYGGILLGSLPETYQVFSGHGGILRRVEDFLFS